MPGGSQALHGWTVEFDASFAISNIWGAEIVSHVGNHYVIRNLDWNSERAGGRPGKLRLPGHVRAGGTAGIRTGPQWRWREPAAGRSFRRCRSATPHRRKAMPGIAAHLHGQALAGSHRTGDRPLCDRRRHGVGRIGLCRSSPAPLTFAAGEDLKTISVAITGDSACRGQRDLQRHPVRARRAPPSPMARPVGTIVNDDVAPPPPPATGGAALDYAVTSNWGSGFNGAMTVTAGSGGLNGWTVEFNTSAAHHQHLERRDREPSRRPLCRAQRASGTARSPAGQGRVVRLPGDAAAARHRRVGLHDQWRRRGSRPVPPAPPSLSVADATVSEGNSGTHDLAFTVTLSAAATGPVDGRLCHRQRHGDGRQRLCRPDRNVDLRRRRDLEGGPCPGVGRYRGRGNETLTLSLIVTQPERPSPTPRRPARSPTTTWRRRPRSPSAISTFAEGSAAAPDMPLSR